jgi:hypothetical protein
MNAFRRLCGMALAVLCTTLPARVHAQADEIQVYQGGLAAVGTLNITLHNNVTPKGIGTPAFPGAVVADRSWNGVPEFAYGVTRWFEAGLYLPLYTLDKNEGFGLDGFKLRTLFAAPNGENRTFAYGLGFELSFNDKRWDTNRITSEFRPILAWHLSPVDVIVNPIFDTSYEGGLRSLEFAPSMRVAYNINSVWAGAIEEYANLGQVRALQAGRQASHQLYAVIDHAGATWDLEIGAGVGLTKSADRFTLKLIAARDLYARKR